MTKKCYYALFDNQIGQIASTGFNERSKNAIRAHLINFLLLGDFSEEGEDSIKNNTLEELLNYYEFILLKSDTRFDDESEKKLDSLMYYSQQIIVKHWNSQRILQNILYFNQEKKGGRIWEKVKADTISLRD